MVAVAIALGVGAAESSPASGTGANDQVWRELTSSHFVLLTQLSRDKALTLLAQLEFSRAGLVQAVLDGRDDERAQLEVVAFATAEGFAPYVAEQPPGTEAFVGKKGATRKRLVLGPVPEFRQQLNLSHEIAHHLLFLRYPIQPPWFREGMAKFLESVSCPPADRYAVGLGLFPSELKQALAAPVAARTLVDRDEDDEDSWQRQAWSQLLVHYLTSRHPVALHAFEQRLAQMEDAREAWNGAFPKWSLVPPGDTSDLDRELAAFAREPDQAARAYFVARGAPSSRERILPPADVVVLKLLLQRRWPPGQFEAELARAESLDPTNVGVLAIQAERNPANAPGIARRAVEAHPDQAGAWLLRGRWPAVGAQPEAAYRQAVALAPDDTGVLLALAQHLLWTNKHEEALALSTRVQREVPWSFTATITLAEALADSGRCEQARTVARRARLLAKRSDLGAVIEGELSARLMRCDESGTPKANGTVQPERRPADAGAAGGAHGAGDGTPRVEGRRL